MKHTPSYGDNISQKEVSSSAKESRRLRVKVTACFKTMLSGLGNLAQWWSAFLWSSWPWVLSSALGGKNKINQICSERKQNSDGLSWITQQYFFFTSYLLIVWRNFCGKQLIFLEYLAQGHCWDLAGWIPQKLSMRRQSPLVTRTSSHLKEQYIFHRIGWCVKQTTSSKKQAHWEWWKLWMVFPGSMPDVRQFV